MRKPTISALLSLVLVTALTGCATAPPAPPAPAAVPPTARPSPNVYFYPLHGQSADRADRDRYECFLWARRQTGFDPGVPLRDYGPPVQVAAVPPAGYDTLAGAATGAVIGAAVSEPWNTGEGAVIGAVAGAVIGAVADSSRQQTAHRIEAQANAGRAQSIAVADAQVVDYRNAMKACLGARGYTVQ